MKLGSYLNDAKSSKEVVSKMKARGHFDKISKFIKNRAKFFGVRNTAVIGIGIYGLHEIKNDMSGCIEYTMGGGTCKVRSRTCTEAYRQVGSSIKFCPEEDNTIVQCTDESKPCEKCTDEVMLPHRANNTEYARIHYVCRELPSFS